MPRMKRTVDTPIFGIFAVFLPRGFTFAPPVSCPVPGCSGQWYAQRGRIAFERDVDSSPMKDRTHSSFSDHPVTYSDRLTGRTVRQLTTYRGHSSHPYFTDPCWFNDGNSFIFTSDRNGMSNLFRYDLDTNAIHQLTNLSDVHRENERVFDYRPQGAWSEINKRCYYWWCNVLYELDVDTGDERTVFRAPDDRDPESMLIISTASQPGTERR